MTGGNNHAETDRPTTPILTLQGATKKVTGAVWLEGVPVVITVVLLARFVQPSAAITGEKAVPTLTAPSPDRRDISFPRRVF